jgi:flavin-binding protein dodecin
MGVVKVIELVGTSRQNWTDAVDNAVMEASKTAASPSTRPT